MCVCVCVYIQAHHVAAGPGLTLPLTTPFYLSVPVSGRVLRQVQLSGELLQLQRIMVPEPIHTQVSIVGAPIGRP